MNSSLSHIKTLLKDIFTYGISSILGRLIGIFLTPFYTRVFVPADYGVMSVLNGIVVLVNIIAFLGLDNSTARWYYDTDCVNDRKITINTFGWFALISSSFFGILLYFLAPLFAESVLKDSTTIIYIQLIAISLPITSWSTVAIKVLRYAREPKTVAVISIIGMLLTVALNVLFVLILDYGLLGVYYALIITSLIILIISLYSIRNWITKPKIPKQRLKSMLAFSLPLVPGSIFSWVTNLASVYILLLYMNKTEVGLYQIGTSIASILMLVINAFQSAFGPYAFSIIEQKNVKKIYALFFEVYVVVMSVILFALILFSKDILVILTTPAYYDAAMVANLLAISFFFSSLLEFSSLGLTIVKKTKQIGIGILIPGVFLLIFSNLLIPFWGKEGAAITVIIAQAIGVIYIFYFSQKHYFIPFKFGKMSLLFFTIIGIGMLMDYIVNFMQMPFFKDILARTILFFVGLSIITYFYKFKVNEVILKLKKK